MNDFDSESVDRVVAHAMGQYELRRQIARAKAAAAKTTKAFIFDIQFCKNTIPPADPANPWR